MKTETQIFWRKVAIRRARDIANLRSINAKLLAAAKLARDTIGCYECDDTVETIIVAAIAEAESYEN